MGLRVALASNGRMGLMLLDAIQGSSHQVVGIIRDGRAQAGVPAWIDYSVGLVVGMEGQSIRRRVPVARLTDQRSSQVERVASWRPDILLSANFGVIFRRPLLGVPAVGALNVHWSLLPQFRGPQPAAQAILAGEPYTGVSIHGLVPKIDAGPIFDQVQMPLYETDTAAGVYFRACGVAAERIVPVLDRIETAGFHGNPQHSDIGSYFPRATISDVELDFRQGVMDVYRVIRAFSDPMPRFYWRGRTVFVHRAVPAPGMDGPPGVLLESGKTPVIGCGSGAIRIVSAFTTWPPSPWPGILQRPRKGEVVG